MKKLHFKFGEIHLLKLIGIGIKDAHTSSKVVLTEECPKRFERHRYCYYAQSKNAT